MISRGIVNEGSGIGCLAEVASCQLEYAYLAQLTGKKEHHDRVSSHTCVNIFLQMT